MMKICAELPFRVYVKLPSAGEKKLLARAAPLYGLGTLKIVLLHYSFRPEMGGVEHVMRDQANMFAWRGA